MGFLEDIGRIPLEFFEGLFKKGLLGYVTIGAVFFFIWLITK